MGREGMWAGRKGVHAHWTTLNVLLPILGAAISGAHGKGRLPPDPGSARRAGGGDSLCGTDPDQSSRPCSSSGRGKDAGARVHRKAVGGDGGSEEEGKREKTRMLVGNHRSLESDKEGCDDDGVFR